MMRFSTFDHRSHTFSSSDCDLAILELAEETPEFWEGVEGLVLVNDVPYLNDRVRVCGYPVGRSLRMEVLKVLEPT